MSDFISGINEKHLTLNTFLSNVDASVNRLWCFMIKKVILLVLVASTQLWAWGAKFDIVNNTSCNIDFVGSRDSINVSEHDVPYNIGPHSRERVHIKGNGMFYFTEIFAVSCDDNKPEYIINSVSFAPGSGYSGFAYLSCAPTDELIDCDYDVTNKLALRRGGSSFLSIVLYNK